MKQDLPEFDILLQLAEHDPEQLETIRQRLASNTINSAPAYLRHRLRGLQFRIDSTRRLAKSPMAACIQISEMMCDSFEQLRQVLNGVSNDPMATSELPAKAQVLPFHRH